MEVQKNKNKRSPRKLDQNQVRNFCFGRFGSKVVCRHILTGFNLLHERMKMWNRSTGLNPTPLKVRYTVSVLAAGLSHREVL